MGNKSPALVLEKVQVEVNVQDHFSQLAGALREGNNPLIKAGGATLPAETWELWFQSWLETLQPSISPINAYELCLRLTNDIEIQALNAQYRQQNQPTDVLAFAALEVDSPQLEDLVLPIYLGDIVISVETAGRQAEESKILEVGHSLEQELAWLATHGLLHLLGWDHPDDLTLRQMLYQQDTLLQTIGFTCKTKLGF